MKNIMNNIKEQTKDVSNCEICGNPAKFITDPFEEEMNDRIVLRWLCSDCYNAQVQET